jgi:peptide/nickel transport system substrate-binding protein
VKARWLALAGIAVLTLLFAACGGSQTGTSGGPSTASQGGTPPATGKPVRGGTLTIAMARDVTTFDPLRAQDVYSAMVLDNVADSLFQVDRQGNVVGRLVEKSENPEPNIYVWTLRRGVKFSDGSDLNAEAVKFNIDRHRNDEKSTRYQDVKDITSIETPDPYTLRVTLKTPFRPFLSKFVGGAGIILNPRAVQTLGDSLQRDLTNAGSGPFKFVEWKKDTQVVLERNPGYWGKDADGQQLPYLDKIVLKPFPDENVRLTNIRTGEVDVLVGNPPYKDVKELKGSGDLVVSEAPGLGFSFVMFNTSKAPFDNAALRRAVSYAIDREQIRRTVFFDNGAVLDTVIPESLPTFYQKDAAFHPFLKPDAAKVRQELQAGGRASGFKFAFQISNASPELQQTAELIKDQLKPFGIDMEIQLLEFAKVIANGNSGDYEALALGWSGSIDPDGNTYSLMYTRAGFNFMKLSNPQLDALLDAGRTQLEPAKAKEAYDGIVRWVNQEQPMIVYFNPPQIVTLRKKVQNYTNGYNGYWGARDFERIWKTP